MAIRRLRPERKESRGQGSSRLRDGTRQQSCHPMRIIFVDAPRHRPAVRVRRVVVKKINDTKKT